MYFFSVFQTQNIPGCNDLRSQQPGYAAVVLTHRRKPGRKIYTSVKNNYSDITDKLGEPLWWDQNGVPRYDKFESHFQCGISIQAVALLKIYCQYCEKKFTVTSTFDDNFVYKFYLQKRIERIETLAKEHRNILFHELIENIRPHTNDILQPVRPTFYNIGSFSYGDPPSHGCIGDTMGSIEQYVLQYWESGHVVTDGSIKDDYGQPIGGKVISGSYAWVRYAEHEVNVYPTWVKKIRRTFKCNDLDTIRPNLNSVDLKQRFRERLYQLRAKKDKDFTKKTEDQDKT